MLRMDQIHVVRHKVLVEKRSVRSVATELGLSRNTVRKYLGQSEPGRRRGTPRMTPAFAAARARIDALLEEWAPRTTAKQRVTGSLVWQQLRSEGHDVGITTVRDHLLKLRRARTEVFVPLVHLPGDGAQIDFFEVAVDIGGQRVAVWMFVLRLMHSRRDYAWLYEHCDQVSFLDGHLRAFAHFGAVPQRCIYDNLSSAVKRILPKRELTARFAALVSHFLFEPCFARVGEGHDKGGVEGRGRGIRLQELTPVPQGDSLAAINEKLLGGLDAKVDASRFDADRQAMLPLNAAPFEPATVVHVTARSNSTVQVAGAIYSVPSRWARRDLEAYAGVSTVRLVCGGECIERPRQGRGGRLIRYRDYLPELSRKPQALRQVAHQLLSELGEPYTSLWRLLVDAHGPQDAARVLAKVLAAVSRDGGEAVAEALKPFMMEEPDLTPTATPIPTHVDVPETLAHHRVESACARDYDILLAEACYE